MRQPIHIFLLPCIFFCLCERGWGQADYPWLRVGDELYKNHGYTDAETAYRKALEEKDKPSTAYNLGNTVYNQNRLPEAIQQYQKSIESASDTDLKAKAWYNIGNAHFQNKDFENSVKAYKESLKLHPEDEDAKKNLMLAMQQYQQQQQQKQQQQDQQQEEKQNQENNNQQQQAEQDNNDKQDEKQPNTKQQQQEQQEQQQAPEDLSNEEAREILKAMEREDQRVQEKLKKVNGKIAPPVKDW